MSFKRYETQVKEFDLGKFGTMKYAQWGHPLEGTKNFTEAQIVLLKKYIKEGSTVVDIGAHTGDTTIPFAFATGRNGTVIGFEPNPAVFTVLTENARAAAFKNGCNVIATNYAITDLPLGSTGLYTFHYSDEDLCNGGFMDALETGVGTGGHWWPVEVKGINLLTWFDRHHRELVKNISFIKIDAEGFDAKIINNESFRVLVRMNHPVIQTELYDGLLGDEKAFLWDTITSLGYSIYDFSAAGKDVDLVGPAIDKTTLLTMHNISGHDLICFFGGIEQWKRQQG